MNDDLLGRAFPGEHGPELIHIPCRCVACSTLTESWAPRSVPDPMPASAVAINARHIVAAVVDCLADACRWVATRVGL